MNEKVILKRKRKEKNITTLQFIFIAFGLGWREVEERKPW